MQTEQMQIPVDLLVHQLQQIPGIFVSIDYLDPNRRPVFKPDVSFEVFARFWLNTYKRGTVKGNSFRSTYYEPVELHLIPCFGKWRLRDVKAADVMAFFQSLKDKYALETQRKIRYALSAIYEAAIDNEVVYYNPVRKSLKLESSILPIIKHTWTEEQSATAYKFALTHPAGLDVITLMETALSRSELLGLFASDHCYKRCCLYIRDGLVYVKPTPEEDSELVREGLKNPYRHRVIPISPLLNEMLRLKPKTIYIGGNQRKKTVAQKVTPQYLFHAPDGGPYDPNNWYRRVFMKFMRDLHEAHPEVSMLKPHELRHTRSTQLKNQGRDLYSVARLLGHSGLKMLTKRYLHDDLEALRKAIGLEG